MKLAEIKLKNFRGYEQETVIPVDALTVLVGRNDAGKSTILEALDIYFNNEKIDRSDCCVRSGSTDVKISCVFDELPASLIIDELSPTTLQAEYLVRSDGRLEIVKKYDCSGASGKMSAFAIANHPSAAGVDDLLSLKLTELRAKAQQLNVDLSSVNQTIKAQVRAAIWQSITNLQVQEREVALKKESAKDAWDQIEKYMPVYALFKSDRASTDQDAEAQDPMKIAIKEVIRRKEVELNNVIADIQAELKSVANKTVEKIREMNPELASQMNPSVENKNWDSLFKVSLTGEDDIPINKRGSGTRRLVLLNFFRAQAESAVGERDTGIIYAVEEPETSQHPDHQKMLLKAFEQLVEQNRCQVLLTTHTPTLARRVNQSCLRLIHKLDGEPKVELGSNESTLPKVISTLGVLPDNDIKVFFGVEGKHDISFLGHISNILSALEPDIPNLIEAEKSGALVFVPLGGSSLDLWRNRLENMNRPEFYLTDRDAQPPSTAAYQKYVDEWNGRENCTAWITSKLELENFLHLSLLQSEYQNYSGTGADFDDVPALVAEAKHTASESLTPWNELSEKDRKNKVSRAKKDLNNNLVQKMTPALLTSSDANGEVRGWLRAIGQSLNT
ncbi:ATP-binding protein [Limnohabitans sp. DM1]|uniref:ATP-binding protein n=1 Tax=Limnohabitans sp. DM1 TaxID=1597955 RepID=UPI000ADE3276|nr:ATP-binding protein [Limnohabitans sp. DM1]